MTGGRPGPPASSSHRRGIRVSVSSTFRDMQRERDELVKRVFPELRRRCAERGVAWGEVDLRWGITDERKAEEGVLPVCLAEIERCRPYFIGLLGERYGWIPEPLAADVLEAWPPLREYAGRSVTELEIVAGVLDDPGMARHAFFYFRDPAYAETRPEAERADFRELPTAEEVRELGPEEAKRRAEERRRELDHRAGLGIALANQALVHRKRGETGRATALLEEAEGIFREPGDVLKLAKVLVNRGMLVGEGGRPAEALALISDAHRIAAEHGLSDLADRTGALLDHLRSEIREVVPGWQP